MGRKKQKEIKAGYYASASIEGDLKYLENLWAELKDTYYETKNSIVFIIETFKQIWNLMLQIVELVTAVVPVVRTVVKKWLDVLRFK